MCRPIFRIRVQYCLAALACLGVAPLGAGQSQGFSVAHHTSIAIEETDVTQAFINGVGSILGRSYSRPVTITVLPPDLDGRPFDGNVDTPGQFDDLTRVAGIVKVVVRLTWCGSPGRYARCVVRNQGTLSLIVKPGPRLIVRSAAAPQALVDQVAPSNPSGGYPSRRAAAEVYVEVMRKIGDTERNASDDYRIKERETPEGNAISCPWRIRVSPPIGESWGRMPEASLSVHRGALAATLALLPPPLTLNCSSAL